MERQYSGENSREFWGIINLIDDEDLTLYELGCQLQELEEKVLKKINERCEIIKDLKEYIDKKNKKKKK